MERSGNKVLNAYDYLAKYYDLLLADEQSLSYWLKEIETEKFNTVLELASGSGLMAKILKQKGYDVLASDISKSMQEAAKANYDGEYQIINMIDFNLNRSFDLILCICDSINYLNVEELNSFFQSCYRHLNKNGRLIFDMHHQERLNEFEELYIEEGELEDVQYQWTIQADKQSSTLCEHFTFYTKDAMIQEQHSQNVFDPKMIKEKMTECGFDVKCLEDFIKDEKVLLVGRK